MLNPPLRAATPRLRQLPDPRRNQLLAALSDAHWDRWRPHVERVDLACGDVLCEPGQVLTHACFPCTATVSLLHATQDGRSIEVAVVGHDGVVGVALFMSDNIASHRAVVQTAGQAYRVCAQACRREAELRGPVFGMMLRYFQGLMAQVAQTALCNRYHSIDQQLSRRLLRGLDRVTGDELQMTQDSLAQLLGVRREGVTAAALKLQHAGVIRYSRGRIAVLDRPRLETRACECYALAKRECDRLLRVGLPLAA